MVGKCLSAFGGGGGGDHEERSVKREGRKETLSLPLSPLHFSVNASELRIEGATDATFRDTSPTEDDQASARELRMRRRWRARVASAPASPAPSLCGGGGGDDGKVQRRSRSLRFLERDFSA